MTQRSRWWSSAVLAGLSCVSMARAQDAAPATVPPPFDGFQTWLDQTRAEFEVPGVAVVVVHGGKVAVTFCSGLRDVDAKLPVTPDTLFPIGSSTKAFTCALLARLVEAGKLDWDQPVRTWLPEFALADAPLGERITPRDLCTHRSGMPRHDLVWYGATFDRGEMVRRLRHLPLSKDLREEFQYNNLMYLTAGHLAERVAGRTWEELTREQLLAPLGMQRSGFLIGEITADADHAEPYRRRDGQVKRIPFRDIAAIGPAGSIHSSVREMAAWVVLQLGNGRFVDAEPGGAESDASPLLQPATMADLRRVRIPMPPNPRATVDIVDVGYAMGWMVDVYRGQRRVRHGGNIDGFSALVGFLPALDHGFVVLTNLDATPLPELALRRLCDHAAKLEPKDWASEAKRRRNEAEQAETLRKQGAAAERVAGARPSHPLADFAGDYTHPGYGDCAIGVDGDNLTMDLHGLRGELEPWHYDVFRGIHNDALPELEGMQLQFHLDLAGDVVAFTAAFEPNVEPLRFARKPDARLRDAAVLAKLCGRFELPGQIVEFALEGDHLLMTLPGQRHVLEAGSNHVFALQGAKGYSVRFVCDADGRATEVRIRQPEGVFVAKRKEPDPGR